MVSIVYPEYIDTALSRAVCDQEVEGLLQTCQAGSLTLRKFGILYCTGLAEDSETDRSILERMDDVHFNFYHFAEEFKRCGIHFDYVIRVEHGARQGKSGRHIPV
jgi:hypothetical protein